MSTGASIFGVDNSDRVYGSALLGVDTFDKSFGLSVKSLNNVYVLVCDDIGNPISAQVDITGGSDIDGVYSGFSEYPFTSGTYSSINIEASASGFVTNSVVSDFSENGFEVIKIILIPDITTFLCSTTFKNKFGVTIDRPLIDGFVEVIFSGSSNFSKDDYIFTFEAIRSGGSKYASIILPSELTDEQTDSLTYKVGTVQVEGDYCYLSNISKKLC